MDYNQLFASRNECFPGKKTPRDAKQAERIFYLCFGAHFYARQNTGFFSLAFPG